MSFQSRIDEYQQDHERDQYQEELDKMQNEGDAYANEGDAYEDEGDAYDRVQAEAEMQLYYGLDDDHNLDNGYEDNDGYY